MKSSGQDPAKGETPQRADRSSGRPAWIDTVPEPEADEDLAALYARMRGRDGVAHILQSNSLNPPVLEAHYDLYRRIMFGPSPLTRVQRETIAVVVSLLNRCHY